jgi:RNA methyltransferase, TrmH family
MHLVTEAIRSGLKIEAVLASASGEKHLGELQSQLERSTQILRTSDRLFASVADTETPQGIAALARAPESKIEDLLRGDPLVIMLIAAQNPGNVGAILRSAEAFGATGVIATRGTAHPYSPKALRASAPRRRAHRHRAVARLRAADFGSVGFAEPRREAS